MSAAAMQERPKFRERLASVTNLDQYRPTRSVSNFTEINFDEFRDNNGARVNTLLLDFEGTCVPFNGFDVDPEIVKKIKSANFDNVAIVTNSKVKDEKSLVKLNWWAKQIDASIVFAPTEGDRKPSPVMVLKALQHFGVTPDQALMVGDKLTADIAAANYAGVKSVWRKERLGDQDLIGDKLARRPAEKLLFKRVKRRIGKDPIQSKAAEVISLGLTDPRSEVIVENEIPDWAQEGEIRSIWEKSVVNGYGARPEIKLDQDVRDAIPPGFSQITSKKIESLLGGVDPKYLDQFKSIMYENGGEIADGLAWSRLPGAVVVAGLLLAGKFDIAKKVHAGFSVTDAFDGLVARNSKRGPTEKGGKLDQRLDKVFSILVEMALVKSGKLSSRDFGLRLAREGVMTYIVRPHFEKQGISTSAILESKASTIIATIADNFAMTKTARKHPGLNTGVQAAATGAKLYSAFVSPRKYKERHELKLETQAKLEEAKQQLLAAA